MRKDIAENRLAAVFFVSGFPFGGELSTKLTDEG